MKKSVSVIVSVPVEKVETLVDFVEELNTDEIEVVEEETPVEGDQPVTDIEDTTVPEVVYDVTVTYGVNFRDKPSTDQDSIIYRMLTKGEKIRVIYEYDENWLFIEVQDGTRGVVSSKSQYTNYVKKEDLGNKMKMLISHGESFMGSPYVFGAKIGQVNDQGKRVFDCSSFTKTLVSDVLGIVIPRVSYDQAKVGIEVSKNELSVGDLVFFTSRSLPIGHVAIYAGGDRLLHTYSNESGGVRYTGFSGTQWETRFTTARRIQ